LSTVCFTLEKHHFDPFFFSCNRSFRRTIENGRRYLRLANSNHQMTFILCQGHWPSKVTSRFAWMFSHLAITTPGFSSIVTEPGQNHAPPFSFCRYAGQGIGSNGSQLWFTANKICSGKFQRWPLSELVQRNRVSSRQSIVTNLFSPINNTDGCLNPLAIIVKFCQV